MVLKHLNSIIFCGALWGIAEATIGHFLHIWAFPVGWLVWFPLAYSFMGAAYRQTGEPYVVFYTAVVASAIKLINLLMPIRLDYVFNPAVSILLEGLAVFVVLKIGAPANTQRLVGWWSIVGVNTLWRLLYCVYVLFLPDWLIQISPLGGLTSLVRFLVWDSLATSVLLYTLSRPLLKDRSSLASRYFKPHPVVALGVLCAAFFIQWKL